MYIGENISSEKVKIPCGSKLYDSNGKCLDEQNGGININIKLENNDSNPKTHSFTNDSGNNFRKINDNHSLRINEGTDIYEYDEEKDELIEDDTPANIPINYKKKPKVINVQLPPIMAKEQKPKKRYFYREFI